MLAFIIAILMNLFGAINADAAMDIDNPIDHNYVSTSGAFVTPDQF